MKSQHVSFVYMWGVMVHDSMSNQTGPESGECAVRALILADVYGLMAEEQSVQVLWYSQWLEKLKVVSV